MPILCGEAHANARLTEAKVLAIYRRKGECQDDLALEYGVSKATISRIMHQTIWRHLWSGNQSPGKNQQR